MGFFDWLFGRKQKQSPIQTKTKQVKPMPVINSVKPKRYRKPKYEPNENYYQILSVLDDLTCSKCGKMDLRVYKESEMEIGVNCPPFHDDCRCITIPWFGDDEFGKRSARDNNGNSINVPSNTTWTKWRKIYGVKK